MKVKKQVFMEVAVGLFSFAMIFILLVMTTMLSEELLFRKYEHAEIVFDSVPGLKLGNEVNLRGVTVGKVKRIFIGEHGVHVVVQLDVPIQLREDYLIQVRSGSILGGSYLFIAEGSPEAAEVPMDQLLQGSASTDLMDTAANTVKDIQTALNAGILEDLKASIAQLRKITTNIGEGEGTLSRLLQDDEVYGQLQTLAANLSDISDRLGKGEGTLGRLLSEEDQLYQDLAATVASIRGISESIARGEGSVGKLLSEEELVLEIQALLREGRAALDDMRETSPITTFTSIFFGIF